MRPLNRTLGGMNTPLFRLMIVLEVVALFGPSTLLLFLSPVAVFVSLDDPFIASSFLAISVAGGYGLYTAINLAARVLDPEHRLLKHWRIGVAAGVLACLGWIAMAGFERFAVILGTAPIVGALHLSWINICRGPHAA